MIKLWLKHKLAEVSLNTLFNGISRNIKKHMPHGEFQKDSHYIAILYNYPSPDGALISMNFHNCLITYRGDDYVMMRYETITDYVKIHRNGSISPLHPKTGHGYGGITQIYLDGIHHYA